ncbi:MAG: alpha/beta hydrolase [Paracoccaceae bacterium]|nr:alpha/beta hydrolase [Paracoccaceae bacterium]
MSNLLVRRTERPDSNVTVFTFHGTGGDENQFHGFAEQLYPAAKIVSPRGNVSEGGMARYFRRTSEGVYDMDDLSFRVRVMAEFVQAETAAAEQTIGIGYSNGANIMAAVTFLYPNAFDAMILMHPLIPWGPEPQPGLKGKNVLITAGRNDPICPQARTSALADYYEGQGANVRTVWHEGGHEIAEIEVSAIRDFAGR